MNMSKIAVFLIMGILLLGLMPGVIAEEVDDELPTAGVSPNSLLYGLDRAMERVGMALTFDKAKRAEKSLMHAEERLAEVKAMVQAGKMDQAEKARNFHETALEDVEKNLEEIESDGEESKAESALKKVIALQDKLEAHQGKVTAVHLNILERQSETMTEDQLANLEEVFSKIEDRTDQAEQKLIQRKENIKTKYKVLSDMTDEELEKKVNEIETELQENREERVQQRLKQAEGILERTRERIAEAETNGQDVSQAREILSKAEAQLEQADDNSRSQSQQNQQDNTPIALN